MIGGSLNIVADTIKVVPTTTEFGRTVVVGYGGD